MSVTILAVTGWPLQKKYFETVAALPQRRSFDIIGHFDLITKNNTQGKFMDVSSPAYLDMGFEAIHALKGKIPLFEVNTGGDRPQLPHSPLPANGIFKRILPLRLWRGHHLRLSRQKHHRLLV